MIPRNQRDNYERTSELLHEARVMLTALELADDNAPERESLDQYAQAVPALIRMLEIKLDQIDKSHSIEWVGLGGNSNGLTDEEINTARGE